MVYKSYCVAVNEINSNNKCTMIACNVEVFMAENYNGMAVGIFELDSFAACFVALDAASKAANVRIQNIERNRLGAGACVKMRGSVSDVNAALDAALRTAEPIAKVVSHTIIASPAHDTEPAMYMTANK